MLSPKSCLRLTFAIIQLKTRSPQLKRLSDSLMNGFWVMFAGIGGTTHLLK
ncbi:hypothetical protein H6G17_26245 [Chroococcidiopsis sp. FACHB-1243]|uniref:hypothetical protein n=1 Tax=Chroococcidiopsis sp. [FACHB-1243] TaxID=2692781 RepID=UPI001780A89F|nr:hypothetical protein [Chroococcidiopsis sp. [FACHB-1243]]MBD2308973.1 hypothetical protein [Chroococcidiopsis sp. [FACHB-1243]]